jgi:enoyl-CoA hydratase/carnithine racemase
MNENIKVKTEKNVLILTINRPKKKNALNESMYLKFSDAFDLFEKDQTLKCMLIKSNGDAFCAGNDIKFFLENYSLDIGSPVRSFLDKLTTIKKPLLAAVQGAGIGIGLTLLLHCDIVFAADDICLSAPFGKLGLVPEAGSSQILPALIGHRRATEIFLLGKKIKADEALSYGIVNAIVPLDKLHEIAFSAACEITKLPFHAVYETKKLLKRPTDDLNKRIAEECDIFMECVRNKNTKNIFKKFLKK